jgi:5,10-methylenetetrahydromethanopterin reductase
VPRFGVVLNADARSSISALAGWAELAAELGLDSGWMTQVAGLDAMGALGALGRSVNLSRLGTAVVPIQPRHPSVLAEQALTAQALLDGRFTLGIGVSHRITIEDVLGLDFTHPVDAMAEYLDILLPLLAGEWVDVDGERWSMHGPVTVDTGSAGAPPVLLAALAPRMLELAGRRAAGTVTWMTGPKTIASQVAPRIRDAAASAGRPEPEVVAALPMCVTDDVHAARSLAQKRFGPSGHLPSYKAVLATEGAASPADVCVIGDRSAVADAVRSMLDAGATEVVVVPFGSERERRHTLEALTSVAAEVEG